MIIRIRLLLSIFEANVNDSPAGCGFELSNMIAQKAVLAHFPLHNYGMLKLLESKWLKPLSSSYQQPIGKLLNNLLFQTATNTLSFSLVFCQIVL